MHVQSRDPGPDLLVVRVNELFYRNAFFFCKAATRARLLTRVQMSTYVYRDGSVRDGSQFQRESVCVCMFQSKIESGSISFAATDVPLCV